jgi:translation elongation factor EF-Ts
MAGRIESYIHSDKSVPNKAGALIRVACQTDFAARTDEFIAFSAKAAKLAFASGAETWDDIVAMFPDIETERDELQKVIKEKITVDQIALLAV